MLVFYYVLSVGLLCLAAYTVSLYFRDRRETRLHESKVSSEALVAAQEATKAIKELDDHTRTKLDTLKVTLVAVLENIREIVKNTESERRKAISEKAGKNLLPGTRLPAP